MTDILLKKYLGKTEIELGLLIAARGFQHRKVHVSAESGFWGVSFTCLEDTKIDICECWVMSERFKRLVHMRTTLSVNGTRHTFPVPAPADAVYITLCREARCVLSW